MSISAIAGRVGIICIGYLASAYAAGATLMLLGSAFLDLAAAQRGGSVAHSLSMVLFYALFGGGLATPFILVFAAPIALCSILLAEVRGVRSAIFYAVTGAINGAAFLLLVGFGGGGRMHMPIHVLTLMAYAMYPVAGLCAGLVYWVLAGRTAGACSESCARAAAA